MNAREEHEGGAAQGHRAWLLWGIAAAAAFLTASWFGRPAPVRLLFDGLVPIDPYRWVRPGWLSWGGSFALGGTGTLAMEPTGSAPGSIATGDGQAVMVFPRGAVEPRALEKSIRLTILPRHRRTAGRLPSNLRVDGNVYEVEGTYAASGQPIALTKRVTVLLTYPRHAEQILRRSGPAWTAIPTAVFPTSQKVYAETDRLGAFVAAGPPRPLEARDLWPYAAAAAGAILAAVALGLARRRGRVRRASQSP